MQNELKIDWGSRDSHLVFNPKLPTQITQNFSLSDLPNWPEHIWVASSGSSAVPNSEGVVPTTFYALSKSAFLISAEAVNSHIQASKKDIWLNVLPLFHVGGLSVSARAFLSHTKVFEYGSFAWSAQNFIEYIKQIGATLTSLVPTQLYDLVHARHVCPPSLRAIFIGGGRLNADLYKMARELGYPILPTYGMTECCSQIATAEINSLNSSDAPSLMLLPHVEIKTHNDGRIAIRSAALFTAIANWYSFGEYNSIDLLRRAGEWYVTQDLGQIERQANSTFVLPAGRANFEFKIGGEKVSLLDLQNQFAKIAGVEFDNKWSLFSQPCARRENEIAIVLAHKNFEKLKSLIVKFNEQVLPVARIRAIYTLQDLPMTELGKIKTGEIKQTLGLI